MDHDVPKLNDESLFVEKCFVDGEWVVAQSGISFEVNDPATGKLIGTCPDLEAADVEEAIEAASRAFLSFRSELPRTRTRMLREWHRLVLTNADDLAKLITWENGKPFAEAKNEVQYAASFIEWFSEEAPRIYGDVISSSSSPGNRIITLKQPIGVCGLIIPWNFPAAMITRKVAPALAAGCTVVLKSPTETPFTANALTELARRAGIPRGVINTVTTARHTPDVGLVLTTDPKINKVSFTGSTNVGKLLIRQAEIRKGSWELGGNSPFIVFDDVEDLYIAVAGAITAKFRGSGQTCVCANRIYVHENIYDRFVELFVEKVKRFKVGPGFHEGTTHGPLIHQRAVEKVDEHVQDALAKGAKLQIGGRRAVPGSSFYQPTVLTGMTSDMQMASEETFGPVAGIFSFKTEEEVIQLANSTEVGLAGYFYSSNIQRIYRVIEALEVGMVGINTGAISDVASPFGGVKQSGFGREGSKYGINEFLVVKSAVFGGLDALL